MSYFEAIYWREHTAGCTVFRVPGFWANRNRKDSNSRDRYLATRLQGETNRLETDLRDLGYNDGYLAAIRSHIHPFNPWTYIAALKRTLAAKRRQASAAACASPS